MVEQRIRNAQVSGSNPLVGSTEDGKRHSCFISGVAFLVIFYLGLGPSGGKITLSTV